MLLLIPNLILISINFCYEYKVFLSRIEFKEVHKKIWWKNKKKQKAAVFGFDYNNKKNCARCPCDLFMLFSIYISNSIKSNFYLKD